MGFRIGLFQVAETASKQELNSRKTIRPGMDQESWL
jgi:hypothetical protein